MGDLLLTCTGDLSRNRRVGLALGQGRELDDILKEMGEVAEGVQTTRAVCRLAERLDVDMPISNMVRAGDRRRADSRRGGPPPDDPAAAERAGLSARLPPAAVPAAPAGPYEARGRGDPE